MSLEMGLKNTYRSSYAVTEALALIIVIMIATSAVSFTVFWGIPFMEQQKESIRADSALTQLQTINDVVQDVSGKGINGSGMVDFVTDAGQLSITSTENRFIFYYSLVDDFDFNVSNLHDGDESFAITLENIGIWGTYYLLTNISHLDKTVNDETISSAPQTMAAIGIGNPYDVGPFSNSLEGAVKINIVAKSQLDPPQYSILGRIWLFDPGSISYKMSASIGTYQMIAENGGVISMLDNNGYLAYEPTIHHNDDSLVMQIIQLKSGEALKGGSTASATFLIKSNASNVRENKATVTTSFKMQIHGAHSSPWVNYFKTWHNFNQDGDILYLNDIRSFTLVHSVCDVSVVG